MKSSLPGFGPEITKPKGLPLHKKQVEQLWKKRKKEGKSND